MANFSEATDNVPSLDITNAQGNDESAVTGLDVADVDGDGRDELILRLVDAASLTDINRTGWRPVMHMVNGVMQFEDIFGGVDQNTQLGQLGVTADNTINFMYGNFGTGKLDLLVNAWGPGATAGGFTLTNDRTFRVLLHK